jgi:hypothetical protein
MRPVAIATALATAITKPATVSWSAVTPVRRRADPMGAVARSTPVRQRPSNKLAAPQEGLDSCST